MSGSGAKPRIYIYSGAKGGGEGPCFALAEDGTLLGSHFCSNEGFAQGDLGMDPSRRQDRRDHYAKCYPDGYELEFVPARDIEGHAGLQAALKLNKEQPDD